MNRRTKPSPAQTGYKWVGWQVWDWTLFEEFFYKFSMEFQSWSKWTICGPSFKITYLERSKSFSNALQNLWFFSYVSQHKGGGVGPMEVGTLSQIWPDFSFDGFLIYKKNHKICNALLHYSEYSEYVIFKVWTYIRMVRHPPTLLGKCPKFDRIFFWRLP